MDSKIAFKEHSYFNIKKYIHELEAVYPFLELKTLTRTAGGREVQALFFGKTNDYVLYLAPFSGNDRLCTTLLLRFFEELCHAVHKGEELCSLNIRKALYGKGVIVIPIINPDGYEISLKGNSALNHLSNEIKNISKGDYKNYKANIRGVDLEKNFIKCLGGAPAPYGFGGYSPFSEPESLCLAEFLRKTNIRHIINLCSDDIGITFYNINNNNKAIKMAEIMQAVSGYDISISEDIKDDFKYWFNKEFLKPAFKIGTEKLSVKNLPIVYEHIKELLVLSSIM